MRPAQRYLRRLRSFKPDQKVKILDDTGKTGHVVSNPNLWSKPGMVSVVIDSPSFYVHELMFFTPDKVAHA